MESSDPSIPTIGSPSKDHEMTGLGLPTLAQLKEKVSPAAKTVSIGVGWRVSTGIPADEEGKKCVCS